jgi:hypothetical protein
MQMESTLDHKLGAHNFCIFSHFAQSAWVSKHFLSLHFFHVPTLVVGKLVNVLYKWGIVQQMLVQM